MVTHAARCTLTEAREMSFRSGYYFIALQDEINRKQERDMRTRMRSRGGRH